MTSRRAYTIDEDGNIVFFRLEWGVRQYKSFKSEPEVRGHIKTLTPKELEGGYRITEHTIKTIENVNDGETERFVQI